MAAAALDATTIVRVTADCPFLSPSVSGQVLGLFLAGGLDYASNVHPRTFPRGLDTEVFSREALAVAVRESRAPDEREHVTPFIWRQTERFHLGNLRGDPDRSSLRWTVDTPEDWELAERLYRVLPPLFTDADILAALEAHPDWLALNRHVEQKPLRNVP
jgi:spore coat polysaccharide biosynthesis protein SpsF